MPIVDGPHASSYGISLNYLSPAKCWRFNTGFTKTLSVPKAAWIFALELNFTGTFDNVSSNVQGSFFR